MPLYFNIRVEEDPRIELDYLATENGEAPDIIETPDGMLVKIGLYLDGTGNTYRYRHPSVIDLDEEEYTMAAYRRAEAKAS